MPDVRINSKILNNQLKPVTIMANGGSEIMNSVLSTEEQTRAVEMSCDSVYTCEAALQTAKR